jgi:HEAT repeat protein
MFSATLAATLLSSLPPCFPVQDAAGTIDRLINPQAVPSQGAQGEASAAPLDLDASIRALMNSAGRDPDAVGLLGRAAIPTLRQMLMTQSFDDLSRRKTARQPVYQLKRIDPAAAIKAMRALAETDMDRFMRLYRAGYTPLRYSDGVNMDWWGDGLSKDQTPAAELLEAVLQSQTLAAAEQLAVACEAFEYGLATDTSRGLIEANLEQALGAGLGYRGAEAFFLGADGLPLPGLSRQAALFVIEEGPYLAFEPLLDSADDEVRNAAWSKLIRRGPGGAQRRELVFGHLESATPKQVVSSFTRSQGGSTTAKDLIGATIPQVHAFLECCVSTSTGLSRVSLYVDTAIRAALKGAAAPDAAAAEELIRTVFDGPFPDLQGHLQDTRQPLDLTIQDPSVALGVYRAIMTSASGDRGKAIGQFWGNCPTAKDERRASYIADGLLAVDPQLIPDELKLKTGQLVQLAPERQAELLRWVCAAGRAMEQTATADLALWSGSASLFRDAAFDEARSWRERATALLALFSKSDVTAEDANLAADVLAKALSDPAKRELFLRLMRVRVSELDLPLMPQWNAMVVALYAAPQISNAVKEQLFLSETPTSNTTVQNLLDTASGCVDQDSQTIRFKRLGDFAAPLAAQGRISVPSSLLNNWLEFGSTYRDLVTHVIKRPEGEVQERALSQLLRRIESGRGGFHDKDWLSAEVLRFSSPNVVERLVAAVGSANSAPLTELVTTRIEGLRQLRAAGEAWSSVSTLPTRETALEMLLKNIDSSSLEVRMEAIRGLGTLGAVETLPVLIGIVASKSGEEKELAKTTLRQLNEWALRSTTSIK